MTPPMQTIDPQVLDEAADWLVLLHASGATDADRLACASWQRRSPAHARAWAQAELLLTKLGDLPAALAMPVLDRPDHADRRATAAKLAALLLAVPAGWGAWRLNDLRGWTADHRTATGQQRELRLADGSRVTLNTATALDVRYDDVQRFVKLRAGEILVQTSPDPTSPPRAFRVGTAEGVLEAMGTRFMVRQGQGHTHLAVLEGAVRVTPRSGPTLVSYAGEQRRIGADGAAAPNAVDAAATAWTRGMLLADGMRLADVVAELSRYRRGIVQCDPAVAGLRVSGAFPVMDGDRALAMLVDTYPVDATTRLRGHWVTLVPRGLARAPSRK